MDEQNTIKPQNNKLKVAAIAAVSLALIAGGIYYFVNRNADSSLPNIIQNDQPTPEVSPEPTGSEDQPQGENTVQLYFIDLENRRGESQTVGCGDSIIAASRTVDRTGKSTEQLIEETLGLLFEETDQFVGKGGMYNTLYQSDLAVDRVQLDNGVANIYLTGNLTLGGTCDDPRAQNQLERTATQFEGVNTASFFLNNQPMTFSQR
jgi:hypothetical protein